MPVCKFFAQGHCRYGNVCFNEHVRPSTASAAFGSGGGNRFQALAGHEGGAKEALVTTNNPYLSSANAPSIVEEICKEMDIWEKSGMWPFSCFGFAKDVPCIPGFEDISIEEMRLRAYEEKTKGNIAPYENYWRSQLADVKSKFQVFKQPTQATKVQMVERVRAIQSDAIRALSNSKGISTAPKNVFGSPSTTISSTATTPVFGSSVSTPATTSNIFGAASTPAASIFGSATGSTPNVFGTPTTNVFGAASSTPTTSFGTPVVSTSSSIFGAPPSNSIFGGAAMIGTTATTASSLFGAPATMTPSSNLFGAATQPTVAATQSLFGASTAPTFGSSTAANASSLFGSPATTSNVFGSPLAQNPTPIVPPASVPAMAAPSGSIFGTPTTSSSLFGGVSTTSSIFGAAAIPGSVPSTSNLFGAPSAANTTGSQATAFGAPAAATSSSVFGAPAGTLGSGIFGSPATSTSTSSVFGTPQPTASVSAPQSSSSRPSAFPQLDVIDDFLLPASTFTPIENLTADEKSQFEADEFLDLSLIPLRPPPREYV